MALLSTLNVEKLYANWGYAGAYFWHLKELMVASGRFTVLGSGDGSTRYAYSGVTSALAGGQQGSGGDFDCLQNPKYDTPASKQDGYWNSSGWCVMQEVGTSRQWLFAVTDQTAANWDGYGRIAYNAGAADNFDGTSVSATVIPALATDERWIFGNRAGANGVPIFMYGESGYAHFFCDDTQEAGATAFGFLCADDDRDLTGMIIVPTVGGPTWDNDRTAIYSGAGLGTVSLWNQYDTANEAWSSGVAQTRSVYLGSNATRLADGTCQVKPMILTTGASGNLYAKGYTGRIMAYTFAEFAYPTVVQDSQGNRWVPLANGRMLRWPDTNPIILPK